MNDSTGSLFEDEPKSDTKNAGVHCLGLTFSDDSERRDYFVKLLREKLEDTAFRSEKDFPHASDDDILEISDPPYYTACPNPFITEFIKFAERSQKVNKQYSREPFASDVSEGKTHPLYGAMAYHTKVPHRAVMRYILHYTDPGDIVLDGFCGTGMSGVAARLCGDRDEIIALGFQVGPDGEIFSEESYVGGTSEKVVFSRLGARKSILVDLSPAATLIANSYNKEYNIPAMEREVQKVHNELVSEWGWMYLTPINVGKKSSQLSESLLNKLRAARDIDSIRNMVRENAKSLAAINYTLWSDAYICPECSSEVVLWDAAVDAASASVLDEFPCPHCNAKLSKRRMERSWVSKYDISTKKVIRIAKQLPVLINYNVAGKSYEKKPDSYDIEILKRIEGIESPYWFPSNEVVEGEKTSEPRRIGITNVHLFYHHRSLLALSMLYNRCKSLACFPIVFNMITRVCKQSSLHVSNYFKKGGGVCKGHLTGTLYIPSISPELPVTKVFLDRTDTFLRGRKKLKGSRNEQIISTQSAHHLSIPDGSVDYIFLDPPFGSNLNYSELNWNEESWLKIWTNSVFEAIESGTQGKNIDDYRKLMTACFKEAYRVLKPGRWMTVEFSNTKAAVWNSIQAALSEAGFVTANVSALDKQQGGFNAVNNPTSVKQDLVISAYKPNFGFEERFKNEAKTEEGVWDFVRTHLKYLLVFKRGTDTTKIITVPERDPRILYDQMVAYFIRKGYPVPMDSAAFQEGLSQRFLSRDGMYFLPDQLAEYDRMKLTAGEMKQSLIFIADESSAISWLRQLLKDKPQTFQEINPQFIKELGGWQKHEKPLELSELLEQNFLRYDGKGEVPNQIHSYLSSNYREMRKLDKLDEALRTKGKDRWYVPDPNKAGDLEKLRERSLLREFENYRAPNQKRLKVFRLEAVRAGFKKAWQERDYATIITVARKLPENVLQEDPKLLMWYDQALTRSGEDV